MAWAQLKSSVRLHNTTFKPHDMESLITQGYGHVSTENWTNYVENVKNIEEELWRADELQDDEESFLISLTSSISFQSPPYLNPILMVSPGYCYGRSISFVQR
ncbi:hypothetical protein PR048_018583 [Dryococelus australis]|uniref:Uncharacterized protein n=1 Tax=Dryococelus australis TaxID=614101 RepID=A0ABQ9HCU0_9NEOP|nr:hypothetical protein PR048_018583 [Dryococelus australis]